MNNQILEKFHDVVVVGKRDLDIERRGFIEVPDGVMLFGAEYWADLKDRLEPCSHHHLFVKLRALV